MTLTVRQQAIIRQLYSVDGIKFGEFTLRSGQKSRWYIDLRVIQSSLQLKRLVVLEFASMLADVDLNLLAPLPLAASGFGSTISDITGIPMITPRIDRKQHGTGAEIDGLYKAGDRVGIIDDLGTTGGAKVDAIELLLRNRLVVQGIWVLLSREQGAEEEFAQRDMPFTYAFTARQALVYLRGEGVVPDAIYYEIIADWREARQQAGLPALA